MSEQGLEERSEILGPQLAASGAQGGPRDPGDPLPLRVRDLAQVDEVGVRSGGGQEPFQAVAGAVDLSEGTALRCLAHDAEKAPVQDRRGPAGLHYQSVGLLLKTQSRNRRGRLRMRRGRPRDRYNQCLQRQSATYA